VPLATPATSTAFDGDAFSDTAWTELDLSTVFSAPAGVKAVYVRASARDSGSSGARCTLQLGGDGTNTAVMVDLWAGLANDSSIQAHGIVPCNADGNIYYTVDASGPGTMDVWLQIHGYWI
jgi:hypothetical protein